MASPPVIRAEFANQLNRHSRDDLTTVASQLIELIDVPEFERAWLLKATWTPF